MIPKKKATAKKTTTKKKVAKKTTAKKVEKKVEKEPTLEVKKYGLTIYRRPKIDNVDEMPVTIIKNIDKPVCYIEYNLVTEDFNVIPSGDMREATDRIFRVNITTVNKVGNTVNISRDTSPIEWMLNVHKSEQYAGKLPHLLLASEVSEIYTE